MCGIAGYLELRRAAIDPSVAAQRLREMATAIAHRGPDDEGIYIDGPVGLTHRCLSIIDPAPHGRQPMQRGPIVVSYNGEIYNYRELRRELESVGEEFHTETDTEVLLAAFRHWGKQAFERFNGMFALALWDSSAQRLILVRDRIGKKPLYYAIHDDVLLFGSEIKAILTWPDFKRIPDLEAIHHYLSLQYVPAPWTAFAGIKTLPPGSILTITPDSEPTVRQYWSPPSPVDDRAFSQPAAREAEEKTLFLLKSAVESRMVADGPVGAFLSGGVDSSSVCALMAAAHDRPIKTFSIGFDEPDFDERQYARMVAEQIGADHHEEVVRPDAASLLQDLVWQFGQPFADPSAIPTYFVSQLARKEVTVVLTGDGGDEFFLGYERYRDFAALERFEHWPAMMRGAARHAASAISPALASQRPFGGLKRRLAMVGATRAERYAPAMLYFQEADKPLAYGGAMREFLDHSSLQILAPFLDGVPSLPAGAAWADSQTYLPDDLLVKVDVASMAFGLEARAPFLDVDLIEHAQSLPESLKIPAGTLKGHLKQTVRDLLPPIVINRPKMGFGVPIDKWFKDELHDFAFDIFASEAARSRGLFADGYALGLLADHASGRRQNHTRLWALLMLELWFREWID